MRQFGEQLYKTRLNKVVAREDARVPACSNTHTWHNCLKQIFVSK
jgi:hypothetical protein